MSKPTQKNANKTGVHMGSHKTIFCKKFTKQMIALLKNHTDVISVEVVISNPYYKKSRKK